MRTLITASLGLLVAVSRIPAGELHVAMTGQDTSPGTPASPLRTIQHAADLAQPGDTITVHAGVYRERINPPRGGESDARRIVYQAAAGEKVEIKGSEMVKGWQKVKEDVWKVTLPNEFFGNFNPYSDLIVGDWFVSHGRDHHTGAVYLNGDWLTEAAKLEEVMNSSSAYKGYLFNLSWFRLGKDSGREKRIAADGFTAKNGGIQSTSCTEGGNCIGWIRDGSWVRYPNVDCGVSVEDMEFRAASPGPGGVIEIRLDGPNGDLLGSQSISGTGGNQAWTSFRTALNPPVSGVRNLCLVFKARPTAAFWFGKVDEKNTTIWAQFKGVDPNEQQVEINARKTVFYPDKPGRNYITVRGFTMRHAATPWAPPTAEQIGLIGPNWSKGWIIENNTISHSLCAGVSLGKYGDEFDNASSRIGMKKGGSLDRKLGDGTYAYHCTIERALKNGWNRETIGHHIVRNNTISHCEQVGIVGSLGSAFNTITGNVIHDIHVRGTFGGAEQAGIKFHGAIDTQISRNHIYRCARGIHLDWMTQGTRISNNLFHENGGYDLFFEVDHGPYLVDNNLFLSSGNIWNWSQGGAYVHNLFMGTIVVNPELHRKTPFHKAHSTEVAGLHNSPCGDDRFYNNLFVQNADLGQYQKAGLPVWMDGNVFLKGAKPSPQEAGALLETEFDPAIQLVEKPDGFYLEITLNKAWASERKRKLVTTERLGKARIPDLPYEQPDGSPISISTDYLGNPRNEATPAPGPFEHPAGGQFSLKVW